MRKLLLASVAVLALGAASPAFAQNNTSDNDAGAAVGGTVGGVTGGTIGFFLGGPIGAVIGGFTGAVIGAEAGVSAESVAFSANNPVDPLYLEGDIDVGFRFDEDVEIHSIEGDDQFGYVYANNRVWIVDLETREVVHSPGFLIEADAVAYVEANPTDSFEFEGELVAGAELEGDIELSPIPDNEFYSYVYLNGRPVLVDNDSRLIVWVG